MSETPGRARRSNLKKVDYAKDQQFSDAEDVFEDSPDEEAPVRSRKSGGAARAAAPRVKRAPKASSNVAAPATSSDAVNNDLDDDGDGYQDDKPVYTEKGYDPTLPPLRERFPFLPEYEEDGSPKIELIVGRRPVDEKEDVDENNNEENDKLRDNAGDDESDENEEEEGEDRGRRTRRGAAKNTKTKSPSPSKGNSKKKPASSSPGAAAAAASAQSGPVEYEYLVKYKGRSYLHLEWKRGADLESMNKSAKGIYRRYLKKIAQGTDDDLENPEIDPSYVVPEKILAEEEQEITVEFTDKELLRWEKQREKELALELNGDDDDDDDDKEKNNEESNEVTSSAANGVEEDSSEEKKEESAKDEVDWPEEEVDYATLSIDRLRKIINKEGPYYPKFEGSDNAYRDGYIKEAPKKPRASYLFFQGCMRSFVSKKYPKALQSELMTMLGNTWQTLNDAEREPFVQLAKEEAAEYEKERALLEKAQRPTEVWQPIRRCRMVLDRLCKDSFADIFLAPVSLDDFPDYEEFIDSPMDLGTVRQRLESKKYQAPEQFARDMRKVWNNCKIYNQHGSAIWHVADYMSKQFERLYHAWVLEFRERYLRWGEAKARPWEHTCRTSDGKCATPDSEMVICDHCDAMHGIRCLDPPLKKVPKKAWHCPDCKPKIKSVKGARMLSAVAEHAARKRAELGDLPKKKTKQMMYLVKWGGLGYEFCTWETRDDINEPTLFAQYHKLNKTSPDEPDLPEEVVGTFLETTKHVNPENAGGTASMPHLRTQLYAQTRAFQFLKFGMDIPELVSSECGPASKASTICQHYPSSENDIAHPREVIECLTEIVFRVERNEPKRLHRYNTSLPPPMTGEYDAVIPITASGLLMNVGETGGSVAFLGYRQHPDGSKGPAELKNLIRSVGDKIISVDGVSTVGKSFKEVIAMLKQSGTRKFAYMRFQEARLTVCDNDLVSVGIKGRYSIEELQHKYKSDRQRLLVQRLQEQVDPDAEQPDLLEEEEESPHKAYDESEEDDEGSEGEFEPDSDDEELVVSRAMEEVASSPTENGEKALVADSGKLERAISVDAVSSQPEKNGLETDLANNGSVQVETPTGAGAEAAENSTVAGILCRQETTRSLGLRLLDVDLGYSSDEGGDPESAFYIDGVDGTFSRKSDLPQDEAGSLPKSKVETANEEPTRVALPARQNEFSALGDRAKLAAAMALTSGEPLLEDFDNFPRPSSKEIELEAKRAAEAAQKQADASPDKSAKRSTVKLEQVSSTTGEIIHIWANAEAAAATLQIRLDQIKQVLGGEYDDELGDEVGGYKWRFAAAGAKVTAGASISGRGGGGKKAKEAWLEFKEKLYDPSEPHSYKNSNRLRDYQVDGVNWLASQYYKKNGCVLADEMGLGKTVQIVCFIEHLFRVEKIHRPYLVVVPLSTVEHWRREFEGWTDMVCCVYHDRQRIWRDVMREYEWYYEDRPHTPEFLKFDVLVTTYDTLIGDFDIISQVPFRVAVVDEAHRLRNQKGKLLECMREISAIGTLQYGFQSRVLMSGTPLQNDLSELWTLLNFIEPFKFPDEVDFQRRFGNMASKEQVESLQKMISPFMLRRVKEDVAKDIPAKEETVIDVELTSIQKQYYRAIFEHNHAFLSIGATRQSAPKLSNIQMELRKVCNHPFLIDNVEHRETERKFNELIENGQFKDKTPEQQQHMLNEHGYIMTSGKMVLLDKLLPKLRREGHKVLIFSQMVRMLDLIAEYCEFRDFKYERLDGRIRGAERQKAIDRFEREPDSFLFMLSTRAGGVGINLTAADICIIFDSDWNPQNDIQAQARCHRIGQTKEVRIYRLITSRSFEQEMFERASKKLGLEQAVLGTFEKDKEDDKPTQKEMEQLLKRGAYALLDDDNDEVTKQFCADDIESILAKRTRTRVVEGTKTASWLNKQGMVVSKSKFSSETGGEGLDMDDPLFWQKVMPDFVTPAIMLQKLNELLDEVEGRVRGPGRGRGRWKKKAGGDQEPAEDADKESAAQENGRLTEKESAAQEDSTPAENESMDTAKAQGTDAEKVHEEETPAVGETEKSEVASDNEDEDVDALLSNETLDDIAEEDDEAEKAAKVQLSRTHIRKVTKFMSDLKSMMQGLFDDAEDETIAADSKAICQKLLLTISVKEKVFNEEHRHEARVFLKRLEGDRKRRCRTSDQQRFTPRTQEDAPVNVIREELRIAGRQRKKRRKRSEIEEDDNKPRKRRKRDSNGAYLGDDGYLHHSDSEAEWSDVGEDMYGVGKKKKEIITLRDARRRRAWGADDDAATAAGRAWPVFPRNVVKKVLSTVIDEVIKNDEESGGIFSEPVSKDDFPEYYQQIEKPMDYGTMKTKLENGEYRSAQSMQKDFVLILQNCRKFNAPTSDIVKEARRQHLMRPEILKMASTKHNLFLAEDGSVLETFDDEKGSEKKKKKKKDKPKSEELEPDALADADEQDAAGVAADAVGDEPPIPRKKPGVGGGAKRKKSMDTKKQAVQDKKGDEEEKEEKPATMKPRIRLRVKAKPDEDAKVDTGKTKKKASKRTRSPEPEGENATANEDIDSAPIPKKQKKEKKQKPDKKPAPISGKKVADGLEQAEAQSEEHSRKNPSRRKSNGGTAFADLAAWKTKKSLLGDSSKESRAFLTSEGPWQLPDNVPADKFAEVAKATLKAMDKIDKYSVFARAVTDNEAPGYSDTVLNPMDFGTMQQKVESGSYGTGSAAAKAFYEDFLLVFDNCILYNEEGGEVAVEAARVLRQLPEAFVSSVLAVTKKSK